MVCNVPEALASPHVKLKQATEPIAPHWTSANESLPAEPVGEMSQLVCPGAIFTPTQLGTTAGVPELAPDFAVS